MSSRIVTSRSFSFRSLLALGALVLPVGMARAEAPAAKAPPASKSAPVVKATDAPPSAKAATVPAAITPPAKTKLLTRLHATGSQVYTCGPVAGEAGKFAWALKQPDAALTDAAGAPAGKHGAGPSWTAKDGSSVTGKKLADAPSPQSDAVPWLLLGATAHTGTGLFSKVAFVQRLDTTGGKAPVSGCEATSAGAEKRIPYTADYVFFE